MLSGKVFQLKRALLKQDDLPRIFPSFKTEISIAIKVLKSISKHCCLRSGGGGSLILLEVTGQGLTEGTLSLPGTRLSWGTEF